eukprot:TRINITY_DN1128_c0_g1_i1.p1 TRINITY_DN1128_c0_g1~~TRINITY_DN1128_c0_g1_i1.p1  ORF type:complete len:126 (-),score=28.27 TRINITY_DN1128_c0_g1_i1:108-485(-)
MDKFDIDSILAKGDNFGIENGIFQGKKYYKSFSSGNLTNNQYEKRKRKKCDLGRKEDQIRFKLDRLLKVSERELRRRGKDGHIIVCDFKPEKTSKPSVLMGSHSVCSNSRVTFAFFDGNESAYIN